MNEDDIYRASTQYRLWSFTAPALASLRKTTNESAIERVKAAFKRTRTSSSANGNSNVQSGSDNGSEGIRIERVLDESSVDCLTVIEEQKLIEHYCQLCLNIADKQFQFPTAVKATAVQYIKRFYLSNSPMTYHPRQIFPTALFLATKTENHSYHLDNFATKFPKTTREMVLAPEFILVQGMRFTFDVRHPHRGLRGGLMELLALARGEAAVLSAPGKCPDTLQEEMLQLPPPTSSSDSPEKESASKSTVHDLEKRCEFACLERAKDILSGAALLTDAYFLYTPSQIWLAALLLADEPLALFYLSTKFPGSSLPMTTSTSIIATAGNSQESRILSVLRSCADLLWSRVTKQANESRDELIRIDKKLYQCQNPEKRDLVKLNNAQKRNGIDVAEEGLDDRAAKKRKLERERAVKEDEDVFGAPLPRNAPVAADPGHDDGRKS